MLTTEAAGQDKLTPVDHIVGTYEVRRLTRGEGLTQEDRIRAFQDVLSDVAGWLGRPLSVEEVREASARLDVVTPQRLESQRLFWRGLSRHAIRATGVVRGETVQELVERCHALGFRWLEVRRELGADPVGGIREGTRTTWWEVEA